MRDAKAATFIPLLTAVLRRFAIDKPVLELGCGVFSTPLLHSLLLNGPHLYSVEAEERWALRIARFESPWHIITSCDYDFFRIETGGPWSVAFVDHSPAERRMIDINRARNVADVIVVHDTEPEVSHEYGYDFSTFKYLLTDDRLGPPFTTALSMTHQLLAEELL